MPAVASSHIANVEFRKETKELVVQFKNGSIGVYGPDFPEELYEDLLKAPSPGIFLNEYVKPVYGYRRLA